MFPAGFRKQHWAGLAALLVIPLGIASSVAVLNLPKPDSALQQLADDAALASVDALAETRGQPDPQRIQSSIAAATAVVAKSQNRVGSVSTSPDRLTSTVVVIDPATRAAVSAVARYQPPTERQSSHTSAGLPERPNLRAPL
jgi:hypothetical protein